MSKDKPTKKDRKIEKLEHGTKVNKITIKRLMHEGKLAERRATIMLDVANTKIRSLKSEIKSLSDKNACLFADANDAIRRVNELQIALAQLELANAELVDGVDDPDMTLGESFKRSVGDATS
jgi:hypothetical protein